MSNPKDKQSRPVPRLVPAYMLAVAHAAHLNGNESLATASINLLRKQHGIAVAFLGKRETSQELEQV